MFAGKATPYQVEGCSDTALAELHHSPSWCTGPFCSQRAVQLMQREVRCLELFFCTLNVSFVCCSQCLSPSCLCACTAEESPLCGECDHPELPHIDAATVGRSALSFFPGSISQGELLPHHLLGSFSLKPVRINLTKNVTS